MGVYKKKQVSGRSRSIKSKKGRGGGGGWTKSPITGVICFIIILACAFNFFSNSSSDQSKYKVDLVCHTCAHQDRAPFKRGVIPPYECPKCNAKEFYIAQKCLECEKVTPILPPKKDFTCVECGHHENARLHSHLSPHDCPKCSAKAFAETFECHSCKHVFGYLPDKENGQFVDPYSGVACPKCEEKTAYSLSGFEMTHTCAHCESESLTSITPIAILKWERGAKLSKKEKKIVEEWRSKNEL